MRNHSLNLSMKSQIIVPKLFKMNSGCCHKDLKTSSWSLKMFWCPGTAVGSSSAWALGSLDSGKGISA